MFTGIIRAIAVAVLHTENKLIIELDSTKDDNFWTDVQLGDSIAVNGVCLTVVSLGSQFEFVISRETTEKTTLNTQCHTIGDKFIVNLEKPMKYGDYIGGHLVQGHVQDQGIITNIDQVPPGCNLWISIPKIDRCTYKGSITIDGVSLTVAEIKNTRIRIAVIPATLEHTIIANYKQGQSVNIEYADLIRKTTAADHMRRAIELGELGRKTAPPNPWVGCVITIVTGETLGEGYHMKAGTEHAEVRAYQNAIERGNKDRIPGSHVYVTLEPCHHHGRTPPCDEMLISLGVTKVFIGVLDPDKRTIGSGVELLRNNNIEVEVGLLAEEVTSSLKPYLVQRQLGRPYVIAKIALSIDGSYCTQTWESKWITGVEARNRANNLRAESQAILVGTETVIRDNPRLTVRTPEDEVKEGSPQPLRVVLDRHGVLSKSLNVFQDDAKTLVITGDSDLRKILQSLVSEHQIIQCLVEGGGNLHMQMLKANLVDEVQIYRGNCIIGCRGRPWTQTLDIPIFDLRIRWKLLEVVKLGNDILERYQILESIADDIVTIPSHSAYQNKTETFDTVEAALSHISHGKPIIVMDDEARENEGDIMIPAQLVTADQMAMMIRNTTGIICAAMPADWAERLHLERMIANNQDPNMTAFTVSCDAMSVTTGVSAQERTITMHLLADPNTSPTALRRPGHIFPLIGTSLITRQGHTESGIVLCQLAGLNPVMVLAELQREDGAMMRGSECIRFAQTHDMKIITVQQLLKYYIQTEKIICLARTQIHLNESQGEWTFATYYSGNLDTPHRVLIRGDLKGDTIPVRIHSECFTGDVLNSAQCDCGPQLAMAIRHMVQMNQGVLIFPGSHEGRGIGLTNKIRAYEIMRNNPNIDTYQANCILGFREDERSYKDCCKILQSLVPITTKILLLTDNADKIAVLKPYDIELFPLKCPNTEHNQNYIDSKTAKQANEGFQKEPLKFIERMPASAEIQNRKIKIGIIRAAWHSSLINPFIQDFCTELVTLGIREENIYEHTVPGSLELIQATKELLETKRYNVLFVMGILIKGETMHFDYVSNAIMEAFMKYQLNYDVPIINNVLTCFTEEQAIARCNKSSGLALSLALTTVYMGMKQYRQGEPYST